MTVSESALWLNRIIAMNTSSDGRVTFDAMLAKPVVPTRVLPS